MKVRSGCLLVVLVVLLGISLMVNLAFLSGKTSPLPEFEEKTIALGSGDSRDKIALITLRGVISTSVRGDLMDTMVEDISVALRQARDDKHVKAIVLNVDSPGGEVTASDVIYHA